MIRMMTALSALLLVSGIAQAANTWPGLQGRTYQELAQMPDWSGTFALDAKSFAAGRQAATNPRTDLPDSAPLNATFEAKRLANGAARGGQGPINGVINNSARCIPNGMPDVMQAPYGFQFLLSPGQVTIIPDNNQVRIIYTDGRGHPSGDDLVPTFAGDSIGHWEGDTLVVDTIGIVPQAEVFMGLRETANSHVIERMRRVDKMHFRIDTTLINPDMLTKPWHYTRTYLLTPAGHSEYYCEQDNRDSNGVVDLTPPP